MSLSVPLDWQERLKTIGKCNACSVCPWWTPDKQGYAILPTTLCGYCSHPAATHIHISAQAVQPLQNTATPAQTSIIQPNVSKDVPKTVAGVAGRDRPAKSNSTKNVSIPGRMEEQASRRPSGSGTGHVVNFRPLQEVMSSRVKSLPSNSRSTAGSSRKTSFVEFSILLIDRTSEVDAGTCRKFPASTVNEFLLMGLLKAKVRLHFFYNAGQVKEKVDQAFINVPEYDPSINPAYRLLVIAGDGTKRNVFKPYQDSQEADFDSFLHATSALTIKGSQGAFRKLVVIALPEGSPDIVREGYRQHTSRIEDWPLSDEDNLSGSDTENEGSYGSDDKSQDSAQPIIVAAPKVKRKEKEKEKGKGKGKEKATLFKGKGKARQEPLFISESPEPPSIVNMPAEKVIEHGDLTASSQEEVVAIDPALLFDIPRFQLDQAKKAMARLEQALHIVNAPARAEPWFAQFEPQTDLYRDILLQVQYAMSFFETFLKIQPRLNIRASPPKFPVAYALQVVQSHIIDSCKLVAHQANPDTDDDDMQVIYFGPFGLHALQEPLHTTLLGLTRFVVDQNKSPQESADVLNDLSKVISDLTHAIDRFAIATPRELYAPLGFRELLTLVKVKGDLLPIAPEHMWDGKVSLSLVAGFATSAEFTAALADDFGHASDHLKMSSDMLCGGGYGLSYWLQRVVVSILDRCSPNDTPEWKKTYQVVETFCKALHIKLNSYLKSRLKHSRQPSNDKSNSEGHDAMKDQQSGGPSESESKRRRSKRNMRAASTNNPKPKYSTPPAEKHLNQDVYIQNFSDRSENIFEDFNDTSDLDIDWDAEDQELEEVLDAMRDVQDHVAGKKYIPPLFTEDSKLPFNMRELGAQYRSGSGFSKPAPSREPAQSMAERLKVINNLTIHASTGQCTWLDCVRTIVLCIPHPNKRVRVRAEDLDKNGRLGKEDQKRQWRALISIYHPDKAAGLTDSSEWVIIFSKISQLLNYWNDSRE